MFAARAPLLTAARRPPSVASRASRASVSRVRAASGSSTAAPMPSTCKEIKEILRAPPQHWVGNGFHVFPVFHNKAFTKELSP